MIPATSLTNSNWFEFLNVWDLLQGQISGTSPLICVPTLKAGSKREWGELKDNRLGRVIF